MYIKNYQFSKKLDYNTRKKFRNNLHLAQKRKIIYSESPVERILKDDAKEKKYESRKGEIKSTNHWGQRKLFMSEIGFLLMFDKNTPYICLYVGAAPGNHIPYLSSLFKNVEFVLVDPSDFKIKESKKIKIINDFFTDKLAKDFADKNKSKKLLLISDIRSASWQVMEKKLVEKRVLMDMDAQKRWIKIIDPIKSMLKFRLGYCYPGQKVEKYKYFDGEIYLPVWGPQTTTECRLITDGKKEKLYCPKKLESQMFYFNTCTRVKYYSHSIKKSHYDHCYDCSSEIKILKEYIEKYEKNIEKKDINKKIIKFSKKISKNISSKRDLSHITYISSKKKFRTNIKDKLKAKKFINTDTKIK